MQIAFESPDQPVVHELIGELDAYLYSLYPAESVYALDISSLCDPSVPFAVVRDTAGALIGCGAIVMKPEYAEIKRLYVRPQARGHGVARRPMENPGSESNPGWLSNFYVGNGANATGSADFVRTLGLPVPRTIWGLSR